MRATCLVCTLKRSPQESNSESLAQVVLDAKALFDGKKLRDLHDPAGAACGNGGT